MGQCIWEWELPRAIDEARWRRMGEQADKQARRRRQALQAEHGDADALRDTALQWAKGAIDRAVRRLDLFHELRTTKDGPICFRVPAADQARVAKALGLPPLGGYMGVPLNHASESSFGGTLGHGNVNKSIK